MTAGKGHSLIVSLTRVNKRTIRNMQLYYNSILLITIYVAVSYTCCFLVLSNLNPEKLAYIVTFYIYILYTLYQKMKTKWYAHTCIWYCHYSKCTVSCNPIFVPLSFWSLYIYKIKIGSQSICQFISFSYLINYYIKYN